MPVEVTADKEITITQEEWDNVDDSISSVPILAFKVLNNSWDGYSIALDKGRKVFTFTKREEILHYETEKEKEELIKKGLPVSHWEDTAEEKTVEVKISG
jgi:hypothetical protein